LIQISNHVFLEVLMTVGLPNVWPQYVQYHFIRTPVENRSFVLKSPQKKFSVFFFRISWLFFLSLCFGFRENFECGTRRTCSVSAHSNVFGIPTTIVGNFRYMFWAASVVFMAWPKICAPEGRGNFLIC